MSLDLTWIENQKLAIGSLPTEENLMEIEKLGIKVIVNFCESPYHENYIKENFVDYLHIPIPDMGKPNINNLYTFVRNINFYQNCGLPVFMHCFAGLGRSGTFAAIYLMMNGLKADQAIKKVRLLRPGTIETMEQELFVIYAEDVIGFFNQKQDASFFNAKKIVEILRKKCPWDREQTHESLIESLLDESFEVVEAIREKNMEHLKEEIGDLLLQPLIQAQVAQDGNDFTIYDSIDVLIQKLVNRHPHVFAKNSNLTPDNVVNQWSKIKRTESGKNIFSPIKEIMDISIEASDYGFDWENPFDILRKVEEEIKEVEDAITNSHARKVEQELGDLLFAVFNVIRFLKIDPLKCLEKGRRKFEQRFRYVQSLIERDKKDPKSLTSSELDRYWIQAKRTLSPGSET